MINRQELYAKIMETLNSGKRVQVSTHLRSTVYEPKHASMFKLGKNGVYVQSGRKMVCIDYCSFRFEA